MEDKIYQENIWCINLFSVDTKSSITLSKNKYRERYGQDFKWKSCDLPGCFLSLHLAIFCLCLQGFVVQTCVTNKMRNHDKWAKSGIIDRSLIFLSIFGTASWILPESHRIFSLYLCVSLFNAVISDFLSGLWGQMFNSNHL